MLGFFKRLISYSKEQLQADWVKLDPPGCDDFAPPVMSPAQIWAWSCSLVERMPRLPPSFSEFYYEPLTDDVEELLALFQHTETVRYELFSSIWREMRFSDVFIGLTNMAEMKRFSVVALGTAMKYFLPPYSYQIRVGGLYLLFAFYNTQNTIPPVKIRLALKDWEKVQKFLKDSVDAGHLDVIYIYHKLVSIKAFQYVAMPHNLTFQKQKKLKKERVCAEFLGRTSAVLEFFSLDIMEELINIKDQYENLKKATAEVSGQVTMTNPNFASHLKDCESEFITWQQKTFAKNWNDEKLEEDDEKSGDDDASSSSSRARLLSSIKNKSYNNYQQASKSRRHRKATTVDVSTSQVNDVQERVVQRKRPPSLRARTTKSLGEAQEENKLQAWLLTAPEGQERVPFKRSQQPPPYRERWDGSKGDLQFLLIQF